MSKIDNLKNSYSQALAKRRAIFENTKQLELKKQNIEKQIEANKLKIRKLDFFLEKTKKTIEGKNSPTA